MPPALDKPKLEEAIIVATKAWKEWGDMYQHVGPLSANPILAESGRFTDFLSQWHVTRTIRKGTKDELRCELRDSCGFSGALNDPTGVALDRLHESTLRPRFGTKDGKRGFLSALSKIAAFVRPEIFTPWDRYATIGLNRLNLAVRRSQYRCYDSYAEYLSFFNQTWEGEYGKHIRGMPNVAADPRFQRRVLDVYLMTVGGFEHKELLNKDSPS